MTKAEAIERLENDCCKSRVYCELYPGACMKEECEIYMAIEALKERPTGKWIHKTGVYGVVYCSECDYELHSNNTNFCPNCGADMRGANRD